ncbi:CO dehydrogenase/acetyl-CoA synthase subunit epsilon, CO dehydrogenase subcomplex [Methanosarcina barkeri str. Wiesmoor]|uniref:Acetyl-CoA decarbonylase/synthase complex subunit epsilon 1 n=2 Tax=Methanosarcina barkeri TaxID=2208 RepID=ACDE1_METBF|nr:CO dehydrogenase/acetyl-CoA synthase complex subunit epsilon [Methanosarcina barkeri]Q46G05.1 RecName: Full=Acetyl-CoA decarbonylase/synthase complex subunit epsilon 1; Short=ACDS complex subunit epsilon 1; AltName: Full=ACDS complex carbon monoxide dehydrogenase subunit epsilon 1; Short=ACDS CODH subunit epsilon 1 [Methanosarcina barkeri str. Fusaro]AKB50046.1 CO dehydrogenase/acetyl-CoA synthase subunit epsilon, CO dehydrogenase subcomplex [Methanosarcina barkeri str. Wiesmoor]
MVDTTKNTKLFTSYGVSTSRTVSPEMAAKLISKAKRPLLMVGTLTLEPEILDRVVKISKAANIPIAATGSSMASLVDKDVDAKYINAHMLGFYLTDPKWPGLDGNGNYDMVIAIGFKKYYINQVLSAAKNFSNLKTIAIERGYIQNATMSFGNLSKADYYAALDELINAL